MSKLTIILWMVVAPTLAGVCVLLVLVVPPLAAHDMKLIIPAAIIGAVIAGPLSLFIAKQINR